MSAFCWTSVHDQETTVYIVFGKPSMLTQVWAELAVKFRLIKARTGHSYWILWVCCRYTLQLIFYTEKLSSGRSEFWIQDELYPREAHRVHVWVHQCLGQNISYFHHLSSLTCLFIARCIFCISVCRWVFECSYTNYRGIQDSLLCKTMRRGRVLLPLISKEKC
jgi:hypothetical protein